MRGIGLLAVVAAAAAFVLPAASAPRAPVVLAGTVTLQQVDVTKRCNFGGDARTMIAACSQVGRYAGKPGRAGAAYSWRWDLVVGSNGTTTGHGTEKGEIALNFGARGVLRITTSGRQVPVGTATANAAKGKTTGKWTYKSGTKSFARRKGSGTFVFHTSRTGPTTFQVAKIVLRGTLR